MHRPFNINELLKQEACLPFSHKMRRVDPSKTAQTDFPANPSNTETDEIPTLSYTWSRGNLFEQLLFV